MKQRERIANSLLVLSILTFVGAVFAGPLTRRAGSGSDTQGWTLVPRLGDRVPPPPITVETLDGDSVVLGEAAGWPTLLVEYRTTCPFCDRSRSYWKQILSTALSLCRRGVVLVSEEPIPVQRAYWAEWNWDEPEGCVAPRVGRPVVPTGFASVFESPGVPSHYLLDTSGRVTHMWIGAVAGSSRLSAFADSIR